MLRKHQPKGYDSETIRALSRLLVSRLMDGLCGCCGRASEPGEDLWCLDCAGHVLQAGKLCERTHEAAKGRPCPFGEKPRRGQC